MFGFSTGGGISGSLKIGGVNLGGQTAANISTATTSVTSSSSSGNFEAQIKQNYEGKIGGLEIKIKEHINTISEYDGKIKQFELKTKELNDILNKTRTEAQLSVARANKEVKEKNAEIEALRIEISRYQSENAVLKKSASEFEFRLTQSNEKLARFDSHQEDKSNQLKEVEAALIMAKHELVLENQDDTTYENQIKQQQELINRLNTQIRDLLEGNKQDDIRYRNYENQISQRNEEIALIRRQFDEFRESASTTVTIDETSITTSDLFVELDTKYQILQDERNSLNEQMDIKNTVIRDLEARLKSANEKIQTLFRTINELKSHVENYENRELEFKKNMDEYMLKFNVFQTEITTRTTKITTLESIVKQKDAKITQFTEQIKQRDQKVLDAKEETRRANEQVLSLKNTMEEKLKEISEWNKENDRDDAQISSLMEAINKQNAIIKGWEEENARDDAKILELENNLNRKIELITKLHEYFNVLRERFGILRDSSISLEIIDQDSSSETINAFRQEVTSSEAYLSLQANIQQREVDIKNLQDQISHYRAEVDAISKEKYEAQHALENFRVEIENHKRKYEQLEAIKVQIEAKVSASFSKVESESRNFVTAHSKVTSFKSNVTEKSAEVDRIFEEIDHLLA